MIQTLRRMKQYIINYLLPMCFPATWFVSQRQCCLFIHSKDILSAYYSSGIFLGAGGIALNKIDKNSCPQWSLHSSGEIKTINK